MAAVGGRGGLAAVLEAAAREERDRAAEYSFVLSEDAYEAFGDRLDEAERECRAAWEKASARLAEVRLLACP